MPNFSIPLSGLSADSTALNTIGNNLSNLNTTAFKGQTTEFENLFYQQFGSNGAGDAIQVGVGTKVQATTTNFSQGSINPTGVTSNLALTGGGYFITNVNGVNQLTRAGNFQLDSVGNLISAEGANVMGYGATNGIANVTGPLVPLSLPVGATEAAKATQNLGATVNLNAGATAGTTYSTGVSIYDSLGQTHQATLTFTKSATANQWTYAITLPAGEATGTPVNNTGTLVFNSSGVLTSPAGNVAGIKFPTLADGAADLNVTFDLLNTAGTPVITQTIAASQTNATLQDGFASGVYTGFSADSAGRLYATFSNGQTQVVGQVAVGVVANDQGLTLAGNNSYLATPGSGQIVAGTAGTGFRGSITDSALELSNVDISTEFANLIVAQRSFEANAKTVTTFDTVSQDTIAMIR
ncbi:flagellar hook protein FlgE [Granulicella aggregans]|uniref:Flagellar hook protein FlgE n=1 Tax=Granulicella aggregans TaxID=474949 RepID=A0A7W7ZCX6_9BACT|nr:flagellar hook protein FlgE [Granulicella aggregans]MBB5057625.1 flagellar hook protein FlgE [Granulicella aggregans]